ncbi:MAG: peptidoglycan-binding protein [Thermoleophilaceae bacterium]|nr:peptidoglycan-binding protein [Thermoleophilaceae bacterium]
MNRTDRGALLAVLLCMSMLLPTWASASTYVYETLGNRTVGPGDAGADVKTLQALLRRKGYAIPKLSGRYGPKSRRAVKRFQRRHGLRADGRVGTATTKALAGGWRAKQATYFGPGLYGRRTACGRTLTKGVRGVAHRKLPCGTRIPFYYAGKIVIVPVVDRGPFTRGVTFDLTAGAARALGMSATSRVRAGY